VANTVPAEVTDNQNSDTILNRMRSDPTLTGVDTSPSTPVNLALAPVSVVLAAAYVQLERMLWKNRLVGPEGEVAIGADLDALGEERGVPRLQGALAVGIARFTGPVGQVILGGTVVTTLGPNQLRYTTDTDLTIPIGGIGDVPATATNVGATYNIPSGAVQILEVSMPGITVTNPGPFSGGADIEDDNTYRARILEFVRDPPNGSNPAQYRKWARDNAGVGAAVTLRPGETDGPPPGEVDLYIVDTQKLPASQALIDQVQDYIAPPRIVTVQAEDLTVFNANGVSTVDRTDDSGTTKELDYSAGGEGELRDSLFQTRLVQPGEWDARIRTMVDNVGGATGLLRVEVYSNTAVQIAKADAAAAYGTATYTFHASDLLLAFSDAICPFYWDGIETLELRIRRLNTDNTTKLYVDQATYHSHFSSYDEEGLAPILDQVNVKAPPSVAIDVTAAIHLMAGYVWGGTGGVQANIMAAITGYLSDLALNLSGNDPIYGEIGAVIQDTEGVDYYDPATFRVNGATANIAIAKRQVAIPGVYNISQILP
jgi:uncharacterized phage protein gp47/JayE